MTNISEKEYNAVKALENCPTFIPNAKYVPSQTQCGLVTFLALSRLADAAERIATALENLDKRDSYRYNNSLSQ